VKEEIMSDSTPKMPTQADIAARAYQIYERRKWEHGYNLSDWVLAEQELRQEFQQALKSMKVLDATLAPGEKQKNAAGLSAIDL
jgi:Protein of unknown function (DUF2934)